MNHRVLKRFLRIFVLPLILILVAACNKKGKPKVYKIVIATSMEDQNIEKYRLENSNGVVVELLNLGGIITSIKTPDSNGKIADIALGFDDPKQYLDRHPYFGAIIGRFGNRIAGGSFSLDDKDYQLAINNGSNHLHGGIKGFDKVFWDAESFSDINSSEVVLHYLSNHMEEGYPGNLSVSVTYTLTNDDILKVRYEASTDQKTIINLTQHSYFNLSGDFTAQIFDHELMLNADAFLAVDENQIPTGAYRAVAQTPFDFSSFKTMGKDFNAESKQLEIGNGYDHCFIINPSETAMVEAAVVHHPKSGRVMKVFTDQPGVQLYTGNFLDNTLTAKNGGTYGPQTGFCLETQHFPDAPNQSNFPTTVLNPGESFTSETWFQFSVK
ncbi:galactose mutarotase [Flavobacteriaceae bacterium]|nr:galactose mutarotase [Flavobacteriaceae bacterium]